jgi:hypothetical protein
MRAVLGALTRQCELVKGNAAAAPSSERLASLSPPPCAPPGHQRSATIAAVAPGGGKGAGGNGSPNRGGPWGLLTIGASGIQHRRNASAMPGSSGAAGGGGGDGPEVGPLTARAPGGGVMGALLSPRTNLDAFRGRGAGGGAAGSPQMYTGAAATGMPRMVVMLKEAVLLNSLKHIMVLVPEMEDNLSAWAAYAASQPPLGVVGGSGSGGGVAEGQALPDGVDIGVHFAQLVKELRTDYATAVAACAGRLADALRGCRLTNIRDALRGGGGGVGPGGFSPGKPRLSPGRAAEAYAAAANLQVRACTRVCTLCWALAQ